MESLIGPCDAVEESLQKSQDNVAVIKKVIQGWLSRPLFERKDGKRDQLLCIDEYAHTRKTKQYKEIEEMSVKVAEMVELNKGLLKDENVPDSAWDVYLEYLDGIVLDGLIKTAAVSYVLLVFCEHFGKITDKPKL